MIFSNCNNYNLNLNMNFIGPFLDTDIWHAYNPYIIDRCSISTCNWKQVLITMNWTTYRDRPWCSKRHNFCSGKFFIASKLRLLTSACFEIIFRFPSKAWFWLNLADTMSQFDFTIQQIYICRIVCIFNTKLPVLVAFNLVNS